MHSQYVVSVLDKHTTYTSSKVLPINLTSDHKNQIATFKREFAGYYTEDDKQNSQKRGTSTEARSETRVMRVKGASLRDTIENHS